MKQYVIILRPGEPASKKLWLPENGRRDLQSIVGGSVETVPAEREGFLLVVNEDGKNEQLRYNKRATELLPYFIRKRDCIVGTAVLMKRGAEDLEPFSKEEAERWLLLIS